MKYIEKFQSFEMLSENLKYHLQNNISLTDNIFRPGSSAYFDLLKESRQLFESVVGLDLNDNDKDLFENTDLGKFDYFNGELVPLDLPIENIISESTKIDNPYYMLVGSQYKITEPVYDDYDEELQPEIYLVEVVRKNKQGLILRNKEHNYTYERTYQHLMNCEIEEVNDVELNEAKYHNKEVNLNKPMRSSGPKKYKVYIKDPKSGNVRVINFGDVKGGLSAKVSDPKARKSFAARHQCHLKKDKTKPGYWSCRANRYASLWNGSTYPGFW